MSVGPITTPNRVALSTWLTSAGAIVSRYGLVIVLVWIGYGKYVKMEARVLIEHSPLMSWIYHFLSGGAVAVSFLFTTPGLTVGQLGGIPILGAKPGQFLLKDIVLLGVALWTLGESLGARRNQGATTEVIGVP